MAIDTAPKRLSIMDMGGDSTMPGIPKPDGTIVQADRQHLLWLYSGIAADGGGGGPVVAEGRLRGFLVNVGTFMNT